MAKLVIGTDKTVGVPAVVTEVEKPVPYALLSRVKDDTNTDIGCVIGYHTDANNVKYAVVCLNAEFRTTDTFALCTPNVSMTGSNQGLTSYTTKHTATYECDTILQQATGGEATCPAISEARTHSFVIEGVTYYGQIPNFPEMLCIMMLREKINDNDPGMHSPSFVPVSSYEYWVSTRSDGNNSYFMPRTSNGSYMPSNATKNQLKRIIPILEIPIN